MTTPMDTEAIWKAWPEARELYEHDVNEGWRLDTNGWGGLLTRTTAAPSPKRHRVRTILDTMGRATFSDAVDVAPMLATLDAILDARKPCEACKGAATSPCSECFGSGNHRCECEYCHYDGPCGSCEGRKTQSCYRCDGTGKTKPKLARLGAFLYQPAPLRAALAWLTCAGGPVEVSSSQEALVVRGDRGVWVQMRMTDPEELGHVDVAIGGA